MTAKPARGSLEALAALVVDRQGEYGASEPVSMQELDYHGIAMLALIKDRVSDSLKRSLQQRQKLMVANEALKRQALVSLAGALHTAGLQPLVFKGTALAYLHYQEAWHRPRTDTDLLVPQDQLDRYATVFETLGYEKLFAIEGKLVSYQSTYGKKLGAQSALNIDVHWRISNRQILAGTLRYEDLIQRKRSISELGLASVSTVDALLLACQHRLGHHWREERLIWIYDIFLLADRLANDEWRELCDRAEDAQLCALTLDGLHCAKALFYLNVPEFVERKLAASRVEPSAVFLRRDMSDLRLALHEFYAIDGLRHKFAWLTESLFPPNDYVKRQMQVESAPLAHYLRIRRGLAKLLSSNHAH